MITIERIYYPVNEFKLLYKSLRYMSKQECYLQNKKYLEHDLTEIIDCFMIRWDYLKMPKDTIHKLHRYAIAYRYKVVKGTK